METACQVSANSSDRVKRPLEIRLVETGKDLGGSVRYEQGIHIPLPSIQGPVATGEMNLNDIGPLPKVVGFYNDVFVRNPVGNLLVGNPNSVHIVRRVFEIQYQWLFQRVQVKLNTGRPGDAVERMLGN